MYVIQLLVAIKSYIYIYLFKIDKKTETEISDIAKKTAFIRTRSCMQVETDAAGDRCALKAAP